MAHVQRKLPTDADARRWSAADVAAWVRSLGPPFDEFEGHFKYTTGESLLSLTDAGLAELEVSHAGARRSILAAIARLKAAAGIDIASMSLDSTTSAPPSAAPDLPRGYRFHVFISYRRMGGTNHLAALIAEVLTARGFKVFFDLDTLRMGAFDTTILADLRASCCDVFVLVPGTLDRCIRDNVEWTATREKDWLRLEIAEACYMKKAIIPVYEDQKGKGFPSTEGLPADMAAFPRHNALKWSFENKKQCANELVERVQLAVKNAAPFDLLPPPRYPSMPTAAPATSAQKAASEFNPAHPSRPRDSADAPTPDTAPSSASPPEPAAAAVYMSAPPTDPEPAAASSSAARREPKRASSEPFAASSSVARPERPRASSEPSAASSSAPLNFAEPVTRTCTAASYASLTATFEEPAAASSSSALVEPSAASASVAPTVLQPAASSSALSMLPELHVAAKASIMETVRRAGPGQTIRLAPGRYREAVVIEEEVHIVGPREAVLEWGAGVTLHCKGPAAPSVKGITIRNTASRESAVWITGGSRAVLEGCDVSSAGLSGIQVCDEGTAPLLRSNDVHDCGGGGIQFHSSAKGSAEANDVFGNAYSGIQIETEADPRVRGNKIHDGKGGGILIHDNGRGTVEANDISGHFNPGVTIKTGADPIVRGNKIHDQWWGIRVYEDGKGTITGNTLERLGPGPTDAIDIRQNCTGCRVEGNTIR